MNILVEKGHILQIECGSNFSYLLRDNGLFLSTEYKVLQSQQDSCFVPCMRMLYNGRVQLLYLTQGQPSLASMLPVLTPDQLITIITNLLTDIINVKRNGFLSCSSVDTAFSHIFVDPATYKVSLIYLPLNLRMFSDQAMFESDLRSRLVKLITNTPTLISPKTMNLSTDLSSGTLRLEELCARLKGGAEAAAPAAPAASRTHAPQVRLTAMNAPQPITIQVTKPHFVLGRKASAVDGVLTFNNMIGRVHCRLDVSPTGVTVTDLNSSNGTYVNQQRIPAQSPAPLQDGDLLRLANSDFRVSIR